MIVLNKFIIIEDGLDPHVLHNSEFYADERDNDHTQNEEINP